MATGLFKKKQNHLSADLKDLSVSEAALSQSTFNVEKITDIQSKFTGGEVLLVPGRIFIRDGVLWKVCRRGPKKRQFFLFNDVLVYGSLISRGHYGNQHIMPLANMSVSPDCHYIPQVELSGEERDSSSPSELKPENAFQINHSDKSFHVYSHSKADKGNWINNLNKQIAKINKNRSPSDTSYQRAVWVPDSASKQCMICKQKFTAFVRKHHCRMCGRVVCSACSPEKADIAQLMGAGTGKKVERICKNCKKPVIVVTGGGVISSVKGGDITDVGVSSSEATALGTGTSDTGTPPAGREEEEEEGDSSETEDSDDSEKEDTPIPPPRKKKLQQHQPQQTKPPEEKKKPPPPPRPAYSPAKAVLKRGSSEGEKETKSIKQEEEPGTEVGDSGGKRKSATETEETDLGIIGSGDKPHPSPRIRNNVTHGNTVPNQRPNSGSGPNPRPVPRPRRTVVAKKESEGSDQDPGSESNSTPSLDTPPQEHNSPENVKKTLTSAEEDSDKTETTQEFVEQPPVKEENSENDLTEERHNDPVKTDKPPVDEEDDQSPQLESSLHQENLPEEGEQKKSPVTAANRKRRPKITDTEEHSGDGRTTLSISEPPTTMTPASTETGSTSQLRNADQSHRELSRRSPSTHARQRRSKFTTSQTS